jgi:hypothetical protein
MNQKNDINTIFLLGVLPRSGTNYIFRSILSHPEILQTSQPGEDYLLMSSDTMISFVDQVSAKWSPNWDGLDKNLQYNKLQNHLTESLIKYLQPALNYKPSKYIMTKTPQTFGLKNWDTLFPTSKLILVIRDGKDVIESGVRSFKWNYVGSMKKYAESLDRISTFISNQSPNDFCLLKYEEFKKDPKAQLERVYKYLDLDPQLVDFDKIGDMPIYGSSKNIDEKSGEFKWVVSNENKSKSKKLPWHPLMVKRYQRICSKAITEFGYSKESSFSDEAKSFKALKKYLRAELREIKRRIFY